MSVKLTVVYDNPADPIVFERDYRDEHAALVRKLPSVDRIEVAKVFPKEDKSPTPAYRTADLYFADYATACAAFATPEGQAMIADIQRIATGGVKLLLSDVETV